MGLGIPSNSGLQQQLTQAQYDNQQLQQEVSSKYCVTKS